MKFLWVFVILTVLVCACHCQGIDFDLYGRGNEYGGRGNQEYGRDSVYGSGENYGYNNGRGGPRRNNQGYERDYGNDDINGEYSMNGRRPVTRGYSIPTENGGYIAIN